MNKFRLSLIAVLVLVVGASFGAKTASAQVDIIRGRVLGSDTTPVQGVTVTATTLSGDNVRSARTDKNGRYTISFPGGEGDYWVSFAAIGFTPRRYEVKRTADQEILIADARMSASAVNLAAFQVTERVAASKSDTVTDVSGTEKTLTADNALLTAEQMGDLSAMAASIPGVQLLPGADGAADAFSVFGLGGDQNNTQLNGLSFGDSNVPRDAQVSASLVTSPYDVARGGFSGGQLQIRTRAGSNNITRRLSSTLNSPSLQWADQIGQSIANQATQLSLGGSASGPIKQDKLYYNTSFQYNRTTRDLFTLLNTSDLGFSTVGVSSDSVARLINILNAQNVPLSGSSFPGLYQQNSGNALASFDYNQPNSNRGNTYSLVISGSVNSTQPASSGFGGGSSTVLTTPSRAGTSLNYSVSTQGRHSGLVGWQGILTETNLGYSVSHNSSDPYSILPAATVLVNSDLGNGTASVKNLSFGGSPSLGTSTNNVTIGYTNTLSWFSPDNRHRVKLTTELRGEDNQQDITNNRYGTFSFNSLADLQAGTASSFTRLLSSRQRVGKQLIGGVSLGDAWRPINDLQIQYGVRMDGNKYLVGPAENPAVTAAFGLNNTDVPSKIYFSPRMGFSYTYGTSNQLTLIPGMVRAPRAVIRGGVGLFQNTPATSLIGTAIDNTGLPSGLQQLTCVGTATPVPNYTAYQTNESNIPTTCADGSNGTVFSSTVPNVLLFEPGYSAQRSLRANLSWSGAILKDLLAANADVTVSRNLAQSGAFDINFPGVQQFTLVNEGGRPVYVDPSSIVSTSGQIAWRNARDFTQFGRVTQQRSDLSSTSKQLTVGIRPIAFSSSLSWGLTYVLADVHEQIFGFSSTGGDPRGIVSSQSSTAPRHQIQGTLNYNVANTVQFIVGFNLRSGTHYTPLISGDVNGDSYSNDRAFIYDPANLTDPSQAALAAGMKSLLTGGTAEARNCLLNQINKIASRNSCTTTWTSDANLSIRFTSINVGLPQRVGLTLQVSNPLAGIDRLVHGEDKIHGWGQTPQPDQNLLYVRGFDPSTKQFKYEVNQRFGSTAASQITNRRVPGFLAFVTFDLGPTRERQQLLQQLDRGRSRTGNKPSVQQLRQTANVGIINPMQQILVQSDSLKLTRVQADSLTVLNRLFVLKQDSIWAPIAKQMAGLPDRYNKDNEYDRYRAGREKTVDLLIQITPGIKGLLTAEQYRLLPANLVTFMDKRSLRVLRSGTSGGTGGAGGGYGGGGGGGGGGGRRG